MSPFKEYYRALFRRFGYPLTNQATISSPRLTAAGERLGVKLPRALRDYYLVAGNERRFGRCHNRMLAPQEWWLDRGRLIFMEENQAVVWWGVSLRDRAAENPSVYQGINGEPVTWFLEHRRISTFLAVMLHYNAVSGGYRFLGQADVDDQSALRLDKDGWIYCGEVNSLRAYSRSNQVVCLTPPGDLPFLQKWKILAGGRTKDDLQRIGAELGLRIE